MVHASDPGGFALELFWGPILDHEPFVAPWGGSGFVTGTLGFGHIVLGTPDSSAAVEFYTEVLGFRVSDIWRPGGSDVVFLHCNPRHHSLALVPADQAQLYHFMFEARSLDDVGYALDRHHDGGIPISMDLGKHPNDEMVSFCSRSPSDSTSKSVVAAAWSMTPPGPSPRSPNPACGVTVARRESEFGRHASDRRTPTGRFLPTPLLRNRRSRCVSVGDGGFKWSSQQ
jgi:hypothetical protein